MKRSGIQNSYQKAIRFAGERHGDQKMPDSEASYLVHLSAVAMEVLLAAKHSPDFNLDFAIQVALLHDVLEDTSTTLDELEKAFGKDIGQAVLALTKNEKLPSEQQIPDSLERIKGLPKEVWAVKLADRISNMQKPPPSWNRAKKEDYHRVAMLILDNLQGGNAYLEQRLEEKIEEYRQFLD